ncbi:type I toxin-antitoxin system Ibs family toxin [Pseudocitrobacter cyperus]|uniref:Type I toxin-antitoxin system Ibs family toxin n=1 Tax=Pseudocitrobacter cyperus TaxID=3112843 RepID=A0ABV0HL35_9ENTR|nr:type I toxin-antitoxin system Ibs family toxin [Enterobacteriaceae bacterium G50]
MMRLVIILVILLVISFHAY